MGKHLALPRFHLPAAPRLWAFGAACALFAIVMYAAASSGSTGLIFALAIACAPALLGLSWTHPLIFPYGAYAALVPFDLLLSVPAVGTAARLCGAIAGAALLVWLLRRRGIVLPGLAQAAWCAFALWSLVSMLWAPSLPNAWHETGTLLQLFLLFAIVSVVPAPMRDVKAIFAAVVLGGLAAALVGIHQFAHPSAVQQQLDEVSDRVPLLLGNQQLDLNLFADSLLLPLSLATVTTVRARNVAFKFAGIFAIGVLLYAISLAASREAFLAVALIFGYFFAVLRERIQVALLAGGVIALAAANGNVLHRFLSAMASGGSGRLSIWSTGVAALQRHWLVGSGSGSFAEAYNNVYLKVFQLHDMGWSRAAHNMLLQNGVEYGIVGVALLAFGIVASLRIVPKLSQNHPLMAMNAAVNGALLGLCVAGFFVDLTTAKVFWLTLSLGALVRGAQA